ncbi:tRNA pseudouridine(38-40) synthase TruA [Candidatus Haliotispira prima]|uniref:tRNA pseudouridine synthase A n=1 Tax=Candidatus Haliotispira prima TaxID=3034016 RepID=A0ABY8MH30_9SPIO|nr:tRNA pseudouridine(38-40) synthase TruA [Candidatus Haliotispira prima]
MAETDEQTPDGVCGTRGGALQVIKGLRNIALRIAYQGDSFAGWQYQPRERTVEGELRKALNKLHKRSPVESIRDGVTLYAAGRTDAGVHATGQVANFFSDIRTESLSAPKFREALNSHLSKDVRVLQSREVPGDFHARYSARARVYHYRLIQGRGSSPDQRQNAWYVGTPWLDVAVLNCMVGPLIGKHDFSAFTVARDQAKTKVRRIYAASFYPEGPYLVFRIVGNAFLWHMVRSIVGTAIGLYSQDFGKAGSLGESMAVPCCPLPSPLSSGGGLTESPAMSSAKTSAEVSVTSCGGMDRMEMGRDAETESPSQGMYERRFLLRDRMAGYLRQEGLTGGHTGFNAPAHGLTLSRVIYPGQDGLPWQWQL